MSCRAYAKRRGVSPMTVSQAIHSNPPRLRECVAWGEPDPATGKRPVIGITDPFLADKEWAANTDLSRLPSDERQHAKRVAAESAAKLEAAGLAPPSKAPTTFDDPSDELKGWQAKLAELKYREAAGELVVASSIKGKVIDRIAASKTRLLAIPSALKQALPHLTVADVAKVDELVRQALEDLAVGKAET